MRARKSESESARARETETEREMTRTTADLSGLLSSQGMKMNVGAIAL